jgi:hypothetical protein
MSGGGVKVHYTAKGTPGRATDGRALTSAMD